MKRVLAAAAALSVLLLAGCGSSGTKKTAATIEASTTTTIDLSTTTTATDAVTTTAKPPATTRPAGTSTTTAAPHGTATTATTQPPARSGTIQMSDKDNGTTVRVTVGSTIVVVLNNTYWDFPNPPNPAILRQVGVVTKVAAPFGTCVVGAGCGTASATYQAVGLGQAQITASRTTCGEALLCTGNAGSYSLSVVVTSG